MARAADAAVFDDIVAVVNDFKSYFSLSHGEPVSENPSPGNIEGGVTTLEEKSLGAVQKAGRGQVTQVLRYGQQSDRKGVILLEAPGNDAVSSTALTAAGATVILFTTGRGTPLGFPAPTLKLATNSGLAQRKPHWIDFDAGRIAAGHDLDDTAAALMRTGAGHRFGATSTRAEENGEREIALGSAASPYDRPARSDAALAGLPPDILRPAYDRAATRIGVVHFGPGAFHRAWYLCLLRRPDAGPRSGPPPSAPSPCAATPSAPRLRPRTASTASRSARPSPPCGSSARSGRCSPRPPIPPPSSSPASPTWLSVWSPPR